jgi:hypothetical protein
VQLNGKTVADLRAAAAEGLHAICEQVIANARPPDATPYGEGLVQNHGIAVFVDGRQVAGNAETVPPGAEVSEGIVALVGYGFPARFQELGTIRQPARPFFSPAVAETLAGTGPQDLVAPAFRRVTG